MATVFIVTAEVHYESTQIVAVYDSRPKAEERIAMLKKENDRYAECVNNDTTPQLKIVYGSVEVLNDYISAITFKNHVF